MATETKKFMEIAVGSRFVTEGQQYEKITDERISCCKVINAKLVADNNQKIQVLPLTEVQVEV